MLNLCIIQGRLACDPELRQTPNGVSCCTFRIACDRDFPKDNNGDNCDFIPVTTWRNTAEFVSRNFRKGKWITVAGRWTVRHFTDKDGNNRNSNDLVADHVWFCGDKEKTDTAANFNELVSTLSALDDDGEIPF